MEIESQLGKKVYSATSGERKVFTVQEEGQTEFSGSFAQPPQSREPGKMTVEEMREIEAMRQRSMETRTRVSPEARSRIEFLSGIGRMEQSVNVENTKFTIQSLKAYEQEDIFEHVTNLGDVSAIRMQFEVRAQTLARVIYAIDDQPLALVVGSNHMEEKVAAIKQLDENVADYLYKWYQENIVKKAQEKYSVKTDKDSREVVEAVKK